jgi:uncharacterized heparinase superfamily protein
MLDFLIYGTFLRSLTLPTSQFQTLATHIPAPSRRTGDAISVRHLLRYVHHLGTKKHLSASAFKQYYHVAWLKEINRPLSPDEKSELLDFLAVFLKQIQPFNKDIWDIKAVSSRIYNMLVASHYIFHKNDNTSLANDYFKTILQQSIYLRKKLKAQQNQRDYILYIIRSLYARVCFLEERNHLKPLMNTLEVVLEKDFYKDGGHIGRNPSFQLKIIDELIGLRDLAVNSGVALPKNIQSVISLSVDYLNFMRHPDGKLAIFNGSYESDSDYINKILDTDTASIKNNKFAKLKDTGYYRLNAANMTLITDLQSFESRHQYDYHSMLSFELSIGNQRIFTNCGSGDELGTEWIKALQQPAAHNMPVIDIQGIVPSLKPATILDKKKLHPFVSTNSQGTTLEAAQSYEFGKSGHITHHRHLTLFKTGKILRGEDTFQMVQNDKKTPVNNPDCYIRFHLGANVTAKSSGTSVVLTIPEYGEWMFTVGSGKIVLEPSIYLGTATPIETKQIVVKLSLNKPQVKFRWTLQELVKNKRQTVTDNQSSEQADTKESEKPYEMPYEMIE